MVSQRLARWLWLVIERLLLARATQIYRLLFVAGMNSQRGRRFARSCHVAVNYQNYACIIIHQ